MISDSESQRFFISDPTFEFLLVSEFFFSSFSISAMLLSSHKQSLQMQVSARNVFLRTTEMN